jgi:hypothetical protein
VFCSLQPIVSYNNNNKRLTVSFSMTYVWNCAIMSYSSMTEVLRRHMASTSSVILHPPKKYLMIFFSKLVQHASISLCTWMKSYQVEKIPFMVHCSEDQKVGLSYLQRRPPQNTVHCKCGGATRRKLSEILL